MQVEAETNALVGVLIAAITPLLGDKRLCTDVLESAQPSAYSPMTGLFLSPSEPHLHGLRGGRSEIHCGAAVCRRRSAHVPGPWRQPRSSFIAWDPMSGTMKWEIKENLAVYGGALTTAGGLVFYGTMEGWLKAVDQKTGTGALAVQDPVGHHRQPHDLSRAGQEAVLGRVLGYR